MSRNDEHKEARIFQKVEGNEGCFNDVIVFDAINPPLLSPSPFNLIFFGGDIQDYPDEMSKSFNSREFIDWNLLATGRILCQRFVDSLAHLFIVRADYFHLKSFANYSNFVPSTDFGVPLEEATSKVTEKLDDKDDSNSNSSHKDFLGANSNSYTVKMRAWLHLMRLFAQTVQKCRDQGVQIDTNLPIVICGFSKGCIVLNELCNELEFIDNLTSEKQAEYSMSQDVSNELTNFADRVKHFIWLDGGHSGQSNSWITNPVIIRLMKKRELRCYAYVTPYQMQSRKSWAIKEHERFVQLLDEENLPHKTEYYFHDKDEDFDISVHFEILKSFDTHLI